MKWLSRCLALVGFLTVGGLGTVALGVFYLWWKDRQWEVELNRININDQTPATPQPAAPEKPQNTGEKPPQPAATSAAPEGSRKEVASAPSTDGAKPSKAKPRSPKAPASRPKATKAKASGRGSSAKPKKGKKPPSES